MCNDELLRWREAMEKASCQSSTDKKHTKTTMQVVFVREDSKMDLGGGKVSFEHSSKTPTL